MMMIQTAKKIFGILFVTSLTLLWGGCAGTPEKSYIDISEDSFVIDGIRGGEIIQSSGGGGHPKWTAVRFIGQKGDGSAYITVSSPIPAVSTDRENVGGEVLSRHPVNYFNNPELMAVLTASPHNPVRYRSGLPQNISGFYRVSGETYSAPDGLHDALGLPAGEPPELLTPEDQIYWNEDAAGGFYAILRDGIPLNSVPVRDALSAVGWSEDGSTLILLVINGRDGKGYSYGEAGNLLASLGATYGIAMDGGDSARLSWRENSEVHNFPGAIFYRALPNHILLINPGL